MTTDLDKTVPTYDDVCQYVGRTNGDGRRPDRAAALNKGTM